ncbi:hypothetical protein V1511DRAFT_460780 [Dipodascopsis uninucleata]
MKRIIVLCDGTWQNSVSASSSSKNPTNVSRLARAICTKDDPEIPQIVYYHPGLGTGSAKIAIGNLISGITGYGIVEQIQDVYSFISYNYELGDELFFFGFSRGAYMVRAISGFILDFGILKKPGMSEFAQIFMAYPKMPFPQNEILQKRKLQLLKQSSLIDPSLIKVKLLGCFDTVGALGIPKIFSIHNGYEFLNLELHKNVENAFHVLALDETRRQFCPTLWFFNEEQARYPMRYKQVWFTGAHINVGGGDQSKCLRNTNFLNLKNNNNPNVLSDGTLIWMIAQCHHLIKFDENYLHINIAAGHTNRDGQLNFTLDEEGHPMERRKYANLNGDNPSWYLGPICNNFVGLGLLYLTALPKNRTVNRYKSIIKDTTSGFLSRMIRVRRRFKTKSGNYFTNESIHESVLSRSKVTGKMNRSLEGYEISDNYIQGGPDRNPFVVNIERYHPFERYFWAQEKQEL